jgi:hypothetical protein
MKTKKLFFLVLSLVTLLAVSVSFVAAQEPPPPDDDDPIADEVDAAVMNDVVPIQGRLTDASGNPVPDGNYSITASLYDVATLGVARCFDLDSVTVTNGLFNMNMDNCTASDINGDALYLGIKVGADPEMTPRQSINAVPYAWNVRPGAIIKGAGSYLFVPGTAFVKNTPTDTTRWDMGYGQAMIWRGANAGDKYIFIPITLPSVLYGQPVRVTHVTVYYQCEDGANTYITQTVLGKMTDANTDVTLVVDATVRDSNTAASYTLTTDAAQNTLSATVGSMAVRLRLHFVDDLDYIRIGGVRLTLDHDYASP